MAKKAKRTTKPRGKTASKKGVKSAGSPTAVLARKVKKYGREITRLELENESLREQNADLSAQLDGLNQDYADLLARYNGTEEDADGAADPEVQEEP